VYPPGSDTLEVARTVHSFIEWSAILSFVAVVACDVILHLIGDNKRLETFVRWKQREWSFDVRGRIWTAKLPKYEGRLSAKALLKVLSLLGFGVAIGLEFVALPYSDRIDELSRAEIDQAGKQTIKALTFAISANREAKLAGERAAKLERENLLLHEQIDPRRLSGAQRSRMLNSLRGSDSYTVVVASSPFLSEPLDFAHDLFFFFRDEVHWNALSGFWSHTDVGVFVGTTSGEPLEGVRRLRASLTAAGIPHMQIRLDPTDNAIPGGYQANVIYLLIGRKPISSVPRTP
jgi:hypothetical protein